MKRTHDKKLKALIAKAAYKIAKANANSTSAIFMYQFKLPEEARNLRKF